MDRDRSPPRRRVSDRRSDSPPTRTIDQKGGGRSSSRNRSPGYYNHSRPPPPRNGHGNSNSGSRGGRDNGYGYNERSRDNGYGGRSGDNGSGNGYGERSRDAGYGDRRGVKRELGGYDEKDREREREGERRRYDGEARRGVKRERGGGDDDDRPPSVEPEKPNFGNSGLLAKETNTIKGVELKYNEPPEARKPLKNWRLYVFKGKEQLDLIHIYKQSAYLVGRDQVVTDIPIAHPSCSKQHAAIQFRQISEKNEFGDVATSVKPFVIDLDSTNGTYVNDQEIPKSRYYELRNSDVIKFGTSSREYVLLHEDATS